MKELIEKMMHQTIINIEETTLGLSNRIVIITTSNQKKYIVRIPYQHNESLFNYSLEEKVIELSEGANISLPTLYFDTKTGIKISPYYPQLKVLNEIDLESNIDQITSKLRQLHQLPTTGISFNIAQKYARYHALTSQTLYDLSNYEFLLKHLNQSLVCLCHNDLVNGNIVFLDDKCFLIDYEYACDNHPYFDLLSLITENNIENETIKKKIYRSYFQTELTDQLLDELSVFEKIHHLLWCQWAQMQYSQLHQEIYREIAMDKYQKLVKMVI